MSWLRQSRAAGKGPAASVAACVAALSLAACGSSEAPLERVRLDAAADGSLRFERREVRAAAGRVAVEMANPSGVPHAIAVRGGGVDERGDTVGSGGTSRVVVDLEPGRYALVCPVGSHQAAGMVATLTVTPRRP